MKKIYITIAEFIENGGILKEYREIYTNSGNFLGTYLSKNDAVTKYGLVTIDRNRDTVQIDCQPIYK